MWLEGLGKLKNPKTSSGEMSIRNLSEGKGLPTRKVDNIAAICEPIV
jgi:hypothetical protein